MSTAIRILPNALAVVRQNESFYVGASSASKRATIASGLVCDAVALDAGPVRVETSLAPWTLVSGQRNWVIEGLPEPHAIDEVFRGLWPFPALGVQSTRHEIYALAFTSALFVWTAGGVLVLSGEFPPEHVVQNAMASPFTIAFCV